MFNPFDFPVLILVPSFFILWGASWIGGSWSRRKSDSVQPIVDEFRFVLGGTLGLLGMIIGFSFSMAVSRHDQRIVHEGQEASAIGTEIHRADLLPAADGDKVRQLLMAYLDQRILHYRTRWAGKLREIDQATTRLHSELWGTVVACTSAHPTATSGFVVAGMNDVVSSQVQAQAARWNRIPTAAWGLMYLISIFCTLLVGYIDQRKSPYILLILPIALSIAMFFIADIDSPQGGFIRMDPANLESLWASLRKP
jgi:hypothetical protein